MILVVYLARPWYFLSGVAVLLFSKSVFALERS